MKKVWVLQRQQHVDCDDKCTPFLSLGVGHERRFTPSNDNHLVSSEHSSRARGEGGIQCNNSEFVIFLMVVNMPQ